MDHRAGPGVKLPPVSQVGMVVNDVDRTIDYYTTTFGWGPFKVTEFEMKGVIYRGRSIDCRVKLARARRGEIEIELIQPLEGDSPYADFVRERGEGLHHLGIWVDDLRGTLAELEKAGIHQVFHKYYPDIDFGFAYLDSDRVGGVMLELIQKRKSVGK